MANIRERRSLFIRKIVAIFIDKPFLSDYIPPFIFDKAYY